MSDLLDPFTNQNFGMHCDFHFKVLNYSMLNLDFGMNWSGVSQRDNVAASKRVHIIVETMELMRGWDSLMNNQSLI